MTRQIVKIVSDICKKNNYSHQMDSTEYLQTIGYKDKTFQIIGNYFNCNKQVSAMIANDKVLCSQATKDIIKTVEHQVIVNPNFKGYTQNILDFPLIKEYPLVLKPTTGSNGVDCFIINNEAEFKEKLKLILDKNKSACVSKFYEISAEIRIIVYNNEVIHAYIKHPFCFRSNGEDLLYDEIKKNNLLVEQFRNYENKIYPIHTLICSWQFNLAKGSFSSDIEAKASENVYYINAVKIAKKLDLKLAAIDFILTKDDVSLVLEVNPSLMIENFSTQSEKDYNTSYKLIEKILKKELE